MINWTEEDVKFVINTMVIPCVEEVIKQNIKLDETSHEAYMKMFNHVADRIRELDYERQRDKSYFIAFLSDVTRFPQKNIQECYDTYCKEYDKLNKHLLSEVGDNK